MSDGSVVINGIDGATGRYLLEPLDAEELGRFILGRSGSLSADTTAPRVERDVAHLQELVAAQARQSQAAMAPAWDVNPRDLASAGWAVVFGHDAHPGIKEALRPLLDLRRGQAGRTHENYYRELACRPSETKQAFLARHGVTPGMPAHPDSVPYYLLLVGSPTEISFRLQYQLDVEYAVGRLCFENPDGTPDLEAYARYARSVVEAEASESALPRRAVFFGPQNNDDRATTLSSTQLIGPLGEQLRSKAALLPGWTFETQSSGGAHKRDLARLLGGADTPALLFTASHGMAFPNGDRRQIPHQGALLCQDWTGPLQWRQEIPESFYFSADDVGDDANVSGRLFFHFACFGAGTPQLDDFAHLTALRTRTGLAPRPLVSRLPQRLLSHPRGSALAVVGHVDRAWGSSFLGDSRVGRQLQAFEGTIAQILQGIPIGFALEFFNNRYAALSEMLTYEIQEADFRAPDMLTLSALWTANNDARSYVILGDPAVRLSNIAPVATPGGVGAADMVPTAANHSPLAAAVIPSAESLVEVPPAQDAFAMQVRQTERRFRSEAGSGAAAAFAGPSDVTAKNSPERIAFRLRRLRIPPRALASMQSAAASFGIIGPADAESASETSVLERILGRNDLVSAQFLAAGAACSRAVARIQIRGADNRLQGYGTGFLVTPRLLLTNNHVINSADIAGTSLAEFNFEQALDGTQLPSEIFQLSPAEFFATDAPLDFTLVAVEPTNSQGASLDAFGFLPSLVEDDPALVGEYVNIFQHPGGQTKQVALRDNQIIDLLENFFHYRADTEPGSSGAPVFNDQWQLVALHHSGVPKRNASGHILARGGGLWSAAMGENKIDWIANEGVRLSRILRHVQGLTIDNPTWRALRDALVTPDSTMPHTPELGEPPPQNPRKQAMLTNTPASGQFQPSTNQTQASDSASITLPLTITFNIGAPVSGGATITLSSTTAPTPLATPIADEAISIDPDYGNRQGYDPAFLGAGAQNVPLPKLSTAQRANAARLIAPVAGASPHELKYYHFSIVMNARRRLALFTAVNIDGKLARSPKRERDKWYYDPRISRDAQVGDDLYASNPFDRGHLVRRLDPAWGKNAVRVKLANDDTFHFTNCSPQHEDFNQGKNLWAGLEDYLLQRATGADQRLTVFTGPVFSSRDPIYRDVRVPRKYWKVAVLKQGARLAAIAFVVEQTELVSDVVNEAAIDVARTFQVTVQQVEALSGLDFGALRSADVMSIDHFSLEAGPQRALESFADIQLPAENAGEASPAFSAPGAAAAPPQALILENVAGTGIAYHLVSFDASAQERTIGGRRISDQVKDALRDGQITDVMLFSHGWQGDVPAARRQYAAWITAMAAQADDRARIRAVRANFKPLLVGLHWPSQPWGDEQLDSGTSFSAAPTDGLLVAEYAPRLGDDPRILEALGRIERAIQRSSSGMLADELRSAYLELDAAIALPKAGLGAAPGADREEFDPQAIVDEAQDDGDESVAFGLFNRDSLLAPLRVLSFWKMKDRAREFGERGVHPFLRDLQQIAGGRDVRFHLMGHSFGCIVASAALCGPPGGPAAGPVASLALLQGALSLWAYGPNIAHAGGTPGYFMRLLGDRLVRGPIITTQSRFDTAVGKWYPRGAQVARQVAFAIGLPKYGGIGTFGIQGVPANDLRMASATTSYAFAPGRVYNLEGSEYIAEGGGISGAHSDICRPEVAHAVWSAMSCP